MDLKSTPDHTIEITSSPSLRARLMQRAIATLVHVRDIDRSNYQLHRKKLEEWARYVPQLKDVSYHFVELDGFTAEMMIPKNTRQNRVIYYLHGGGFAICSVNTHRKLVASLAREMGINAFAINYRLSPENPFPAALDDAVKGYEYLLQKGFSPDRILIAGDSAGGGLAVSTLLFLRKKNIPLPAAAALIAPWTDLEGSGNSHTANARTEKLLDLHSIKTWGIAYAGNENTRHPLISPIYADLWGLPPLYTQVSTTEILLDDAVRLHEKALSCGVDSTLEKWRGLIHVWHVHTFLPDAKKAIQNIAAFAARHLK